MIKGWLALKNQTTENWVKNCLITADVVANIMFGVADILHGAAVILHCMASILKVVPDILHVQHQFLEIFWIFKGKNTLFSKSAQNLV